MIWSAESVPVPLKSGGTAEAISSSLSARRPEGTPDLHSVFGKQFVLNSLPEHATLHLFSFTRYRLYVNGHYAGRGPCRYQNKRPEYDSRDMQSFLREGPNTLACLVHRDSPTGRIMHHDPGFIAALQIATNGAKQVIATDASWLSMPERSFGPRPEAWASVEENRDARRSFDWTNPDFTQSDWRPSLVAPTGRGTAIYPRSTPLQMDRLRAWLGADEPGIYEYGASPVTLSAGESLVRALPGIAQAYHLLEIDAEEGSAVEIQYWLPENQLAGTSLYIARAGRQTWMGGDTFAFRELRINVNSGRVQVLRVSAWEVRYPFKRAASFLCSDPFLNQLWSICARSLELFSEDSYVDCADRERVEWTDDSPPAFDCTRVLMRGPDQRGLPQWADARLLRGLLRRIALTQQPDGQLKAHSCSERFDIHAIMEDRSCDWVVQLRQYFESTGDGSLVQELWPTLNPLLDWFHRHTTNRGLVLAREWEVWDNPLRYQVCEGLGLNALYHRALVDASALAQQLGRARESNHLKEQAAQLQATVNALLWNEGEGAYDGALFGPGSEIRPQMGKPFPGHIENGRFRPTVQGNLFALYGNIVPAARLPSVRRWILNHVHDVLSPMSFYYLFQMLYDLGAPEHDQAVLSLMRKKWKLQVESEWQTTWEMLENSGGSKAHIYGIHPGYFLTAYVLGARRLGTVADRVVLVEPRFANLQWARGVCITEFGPVRMNWQRKDTGDVDLLCDLPPSVRGKLRLPAAGPGGSLSLNGLAVTPTINHPWLETDLGSGTNTVSLRSR